MSVLSLYVLKSYNYENIQMVAKLLSDRASGDHLWVYSILEWKSYYFNNFEANKVVSV